MRFITNATGIKEEKQAIELLLQPRDRIAIDIETVSLANPLPLGIAVAITDKIGFYFFNPRDVLLVTLGIQTPTIIAHNASFDIPILRRLGIPVNNYEDTMLLAYSCGILEKGLESLSKTILSAPYTSVSSQWKKPGQGNIAIDHVKMAGWSLQHAMNTFSLWDKLPKIQLYYDIDKPCIDLVIEMEAWGILIDQYKLTEVEQETMVKILSLESDLFTELGEINLASNPQVAVALQAKGILGTRKTKAGADSVSEESLKPLKNPIADKVLRWRSLMKTLTTYVPAFRNIDSQGRIHTVYGYTNTGRFKSGDKEQKKPNLQNITRDEKFGELED